MKQIAVIALGVALGGCFGNGCGRKKQQENIEPAPPAPAVAPAPPTAKALTPDELAKHYQACWAAWVAAKTDEFKACYTPESKVDMPGLGTELTGLDNIAGSIAAWHGAFPDVKGEPVLVLVNGHQLAAFALVTGTQTGAFASPMGELPPTKQKVGILFAQAIEFDDAGHAKLERDYYDLATLLGQLQPNKQHPTRPALDKAPIANDTVIAKADAKEKANLDVAKAALDAFNKHDAKAFGDAMSADTVWSEAPEAKDWSKQDTLANAQAVWKAFGDVKMVATSTWAAGDYVVTEATMTGTNDGAMPQMGIKQATKKTISVPFLAIHKIDAGKIKMTWVFDQGLAFAQQLGLLPSPGGAPPASAGSAAKPAAAGSGAGSAAKK